jgi:hypothetical protein
MNSQQQKERAIALIALSFLFLLIRLRLGLTTFWLGRFHWHGSGFVWFYLLLQIDLIFS